MKELPEDLQQQLRDDEREPMTAIDRIVMMGSYGLAIVMWLGVVVWVRAVRL